MKAYKKKIDRNLSTFLPHRELLKFRVFWGCNPVDIISCACVSIKPLSKQADKTENSL